MISFVSYTLLFLIPALAKKQCPNTENHLKYFKLRSCYKSTLPIISWSNAETLENCTKFAVEKNALAFNFSPREGGSYRKSGVRSCELLGCPEIGNTTTTLVADLAFDYYSAYGNFNNSENASCVKSVGMFAISPEKHNYMNSISVCQILGGDLADITSEIRTKYLSQLVNSSLNNWYKVAYVGLADYYTKDNFLTSFGMPLRCSSYRAWAPGHPHKIPNHHNCVVLDSEKMWRVVNCNSKFPAICEFFNEKPPEQFDLKKLNCTGIVNKSLRGSCEAKKYLWEQYQNSSRLEKCEILNDLLEETST